ncbi:hypothetical protein Tco_0418778, partial [Tanacetum coccineum]
KFKEDLFTYYVENEFFEDLQDTSESSDDNTNVVNAPQEPFVGNQDPGENSSLSPPHIDHCCHECGDSLDGIFCQQCTCKSCGEGAHYGYNCPPKVPIISNPELPNNQTVDELPPRVQQQCLFRTCQKCGCNEYNGVCFYCTIGNGTPSNFSTPYFSNDSPSVANHPLQSQYVPYSCELCGNDSHYGYDCQPQVPFVYNQDLCFNQNFDYFPQTSPSFPQQYPVVKIVGIEPPQYPVIHQPIREKTCAELLAEERTANINTQSTQYSVVHQPPHETSLEFLQDKRNLINSVQTFLRKFNRFSFYETPKVSLAWETISKIEHAFEDKQYQPEGILELFRKLHDDVQNIHEEFSEYINTPSWNCPTIYCDDDDEEEEDYTIATTLDLPITDSLIMEDEHLDTIPATE